MSLSMSPGELLAKSILTLSAVKCDATCSLFEEAPSIQSMISCLQENTSSYLVIDSIGNLLKEKSYSEVRGVPDDEDGLMGIICFMSIQEYESTNTAISIQSEIISAIHLSSYQQL
jgi:hypothetical protein